MSTQNSWKRWAVGGAAALALTAGAIWTVDNVSAAGVVSTVTSLAQGQSIMTPQFAQWGDMQQGRGPKGDGPLGGLGRMGDRGLMGEEQSTYLAAALGITVEELQAAQDSVRTAAIDQAVADGILTQEQADQLKAGEQVRVPFMGRGGAAQIDHEALLAEALGITVEELEAAKVEARAAAVAQAVADGEITQEQADLMAARQAFGSYQQAQTQAAYAAALQAAVTAGSITQAQADLLLANMQTGFGRGMGDFGHGMGGHGRGGHGGHGRGPGGQGGLNGPTQPDDSQTTPDSGTIPTPQSSSFSSL